MMWKYRQFYLERQGTILYFDKPADSSAGKWQLNTLTGGIAFAVSPGRWGGKKPSLKQRNFEPFWLTKLVQEEQKRIAN